MGDSILKGGICRGSYHETSNGTVRVVEVIDPFNVRVEFVENPCEVIISAAQLRQFHVKNPMKPHIKGIGFMGIGPHQPRGKGNPTRAYASWRNMFVRVYDPKDEVTIRNYKGTSIHTDWHNFQNFAQWYHKQIDRFGPVEHTWELDKDFLVPGNRLYGPETCCVIPKAVNVLLTDNGIKRGELPLGVTKHGAGYRPRVGLRSLGTYSTIEKAQQVYWVNKIKLFQDIALKYWQYLPEKLAIRLYDFGWEDAVAYYGDDARIWYGR